jgi:hypothetical protein
LIVENKILEFDETTVDWYVKNVFSETGLKYKCALFTTPQHNCSTRLNIPPIPFSSLINEVKKQPGYKTGGKSLKRSKWRVDDMIIKFRSSNVCFNPKNTTLTACWFVVYIDGTVGGIDCPVVYGFPLQYTGHTKGHTITITGPETLTICFDGKK